MAVPPLLTGGDQVNLITDLEVTVGSSARLIGASGTCTITPPLP